jgi:glycosyltransferase involved in cell wall biosynthesis
VTAAPGASAVLYVANATKIGGGNRVLMDLMLHLDPEQYRPVLVAPEAGPLTDWAAAAGVPHFLSRAGDWESGTALARRTADLLHLIVRTRASIVHAAAPTCYRALGAAGRLARTPRVCHLGFPPEQGELRRSFLMPPEAVIGCYEGQAADHADEIHAIRADCHVVGICNGIDTSRFAPDGTADSSTLRAGADHVVAILGHLSDVKGHPTFVEAAALLVRQFPNTRFLAIGGETIQPGMRARLERRALELGLGDRVQFLGFRTDVPQVLAAADVVVLPSHAEGFPLAVLEAMACGKPVVATPVGGVAEAVVDEVTGLLVPPGEPGALAGAVARLLGDARMSARLGAAARMRINERFSVGVFARAVQSVYARIVSDVQRPRRRAA